MTNKQIYKILSTSKNVAIFSHVNPDPDAYGSAFGVREILRDMGKNAEVFAVRTPKCYLDKIFPLEGIKTEFNPKNFDTAVVVDLHETNRLDKKFQKEVASFKNIVIFDHHDARDSVLLPTKNVVIDASFAACSQLIVHFALDNNLKISKNAATYLYAGLIGDTGRFLHSNLTKDVFEIAGVLIDKGGEAQKIYDAMFRQRTLKQIKIRNAFTEKMKTLHNGVIAYVIFTLKDKKKFGVIDDDIKTYVNELIEIEGIEFSIVCREIEHNRFKIALRSSYKVDSNKFCKQFGGGGHKCAAGFELATTKQNLEKQIPVWCKDILK